MLPGMVIRLLDALAPETVMNIQTTTLPAVYEHRPAAIKILIKAPAIRRRAAGMAAPAEDNSPTAGTRIRLLLILFLVIGLLLLGAAGLVSAAL